MHDCSNHQDEEFSGRKFVVVEDQPPSLYPIPSNDVNDDNIIAHSDKSITTKKTHQWFPRYLLKEINI